jgi:hypothetical protein
MRAVPRRLLPSTSAATTRVRCSTLNLFILAIIHARARMSREKEKSMGWADDQIKKDQKKQESIAVDNQIRLLEDQLKAEVGKGCFEAVKAYVQAETERYNKAQQDQSSGIFFLPDSSVEEDRDMMSQIPSFTIFRRDQPRARLYAKYSERQHALLWRCGSAEGSYEMRATATGKCFFIGSSDNNPRTPEQIGNELLNRANSAELTAGGAIWS